MSYIDPWGFTEHDRAKLDVIQDERLPNYKKGMYRVEMRIFDKGILHHRRIRTNDLGITVKTDIGDFDLNTNWLFKVKHFFLVALLLRLKGIKQDFYALYEKENPNPFEFNLGIPMVSGSNLNTIQKSTALLDYFRSFFQTKFDTRMLIIILAVVGMLGVYVLYSQGYINLDNLRGLIRR